LLSRKRATRNSRPRAITLWAALFAVVLLSGTTTEDADRVESRRHKIELLSQSERNRLKRNYETYLKLSPERREQLFKLHDELEQDAKNGGHLQKLLDQYNTWFCKLSPFDRDKLLSTADPGERAQLVQKLLEEEQKQRLARTTRAPFPLQALRFEGGAAPLSSSELDVVLTAVEQKYLRDESKERLTKSSAPRDRHLQILRATMNQLRREREVGTKMLPRETALIETILDAIPNETIKSQITRGGLPQQIRRQLGQNLARSVLAEWKPELDEAPATPAQIEDATNKWLAGAGAERREAMQERLQSDNGRKFFAAVVALQTNQRLRRQLQPVMWLLRASFPSPPLNRQLRSGGQAGSSAKPAATKATSRATDGSDKGSSATEP
jgi:hypothetical protein